MPKVSVIMPVYNGEAYLRQCLDSVCAQTLKEIEVICVDDGSTDGSWEILEGYRDKDPRFQLLRQKNLHPGVARNNGLARAQGKYVIFWDCDDFFEPQALEHLYQRAEETGAEICVCNNDWYDNVIGKRYPEANPLDLKRVPEGDTFNRFTNPEHILDFTNNVIWNKLFLRSFLVENDIKFPDHQYGEDVPFIMVALSSASKITTLNEVLVHYRWNNSGSMVGTALRSPLERVHAFELGIDQLIKRDILPIENIGRRALLGIRIHLNFAATEEDFTNVLNMWRDTGLLQKCNIVEREPGYYYNASDDEFVKHLLHDKPGDLQAFLRRNYCQTNKRNSAKRRELAAELKETKAKLKVAEKKLAALKNSKSYRLGRILLFIPRKIRDLLRRVV